MFSRQPCRQFGLYASLKAHESRLSVYRAGSLGTPTHSLTISPPKKRNSSHCFAWAGLIYGNLANLGAHTAYQSLNGTHQEIFFICTSKPGSKSHPPHH